MAKLIDRIRFWISEAPIISVVLVVMAVYAVYKNVFTYYQDSSKDSTKHTNSSLYGFTDQMTNLVSERLFTWGGVSVVALILTMILKHYNDKADEEEAIRKELLEEEESKTEGETENESKKKSNKNKKSSGNTNQIKNEKKAQKQKKSN